MIIELENNMSKNELFKWAYLHESSEMWIFSNKKMFKAMILKTLDEDAPWSKNILEYIMQKHKLLQGT
jgi:hypothetical protein